MTQTLNANKGEWTDLGAVAGATLEAGSTYFLEHHQDTVVLVRIGTQPGAGDMGHLLLTGASEFTVTVPDEQTESVWVRPLDVDAEIIVTGA